jgi:hypothetical protein
MKERWLGYYLLIFGFLNIFVVSFTVPILFGDRLLWHPRNVPDEMMLSVIYLAMGIVMVAAAWRPLTHKAFVDFLILGSLLHAIVMLACAEHILHIVFDVATVGVMGLLPLFLYPWRLTSFLRYGEV